MLSAPQGVAVTDELAAGTGLQRGLLTFAGKSRARRTFFPVYPRASQTCLVGDSSLVGIPRNFLAVKFIMCELVKVGNVRVLRLLGENSEHRFNPEFVSKLNEALDQVEADPESAALVTVGQGKFFSNGLDLQWLAKHPRQVEPFIHSFQVLLARFLCFPLPTVAVINGHAAAGGCMLALAHDYRCMRRDKGFIFLSEVDIGIPLTPGMNAIIKCKLPVHTYRDAVLTGKKYNGKDAFAAGLVCVVADADGEERALALGMEKAQALGVKKWDRKVYQALKLEMFKHELVELKGGDSGHGMKVGQLSKL
eukprot:jgi/Mesvir1/19390/Mv10425-RA.1